VCVCVCVCVCVLVYVCALNATRPRSMHNQAETLQKRSRVVAPSESTTARANFLSNSPTASRQCRPHTDLEWCTETSSQVRQCGVFRSIGGRRLNACSHFASAHNYRPHRSLPALTTNTTENIFVTHDDDGNALLKLGDWGIAKSCAKNGRAQTPIGTPL